MIPELDGYGILRELRAEAATEATPFIFLTAKGEKPDVRAGMNLGADDYLAQGKTNGDIATILGISEATVKKHVLDIFQKLNVETRTSARLYALEILSSPVAMKRNMP